MTPNGHINRRRRQPADTFSEKRFLIGPFAACVRLRRLTHAPVGAQCERRTGCRTRACCDDRRVARLAAAHVHEFEAVKGLCHRGVGSADLRERQ
jgi:hypothetical protein